MNESKDLSQTSDAQEPTLPTWFKQTFNQRIVDEVSEELRQKQDVLPEPPEISKERMAQYRANLQSRITDIRHQQEFHALPPLRSLQIHQADQSQSVALKIGLKTTALVLVLLSTGAMIGFATTRPQLFDGSMAPANLYGSMISGLFDEKLEDSKTTALSKLHTVPIAKVAEPIAVKSAESLNHSVIYKTDDPVVVEPTSSVELDVHATQRSLPKKAKVKLFSPSQNEAVQDAVSAPLDKPEQQVAVEPPAALQGENVLIEPTAAKPAKTNYNLP